MEVINQRSALLSNFEVLTLLRELESDHLARTRTALRVKKEEEAAGLASSKSHAPPDQVLENLRTIEVEVRWLLLALCILLNDAHHPLTGYPVFGCGLSAHFISVRGGHRAANKRSFRL